MSVLVTVILATLIICILLLVLRWVKTPWYRVDAERMQKTIEMVLTGQATKNDWVITFHMVIRHDSELEAIRQRCCELEEKYTISDHGEYLFTNAGLNELEKIREQLQKIEKK